MISLSHLFLPAPACLWRASVSMGVIRRVELSSRLMRGGCSRRDQGIRLRHANNHNHHHHHHSHAYLLLRGDAASCQTAEGPRFPPAAWSRVCLCCKYMWLLCVRAHVHMCMQAQLQVHLAVYIIPPQSRLTLRLWLFTPLSLPSPHPSVPLLLHFSLYHSIYSWISCLSWKLMHENRGWEGGKKTQTTTKKPNRVNVDGGFVSSGCSTAQAAQSSGDICKKTLIPSPFSFLSLFLSLHPPTYCLPSLFPNPPTSTPSL